MIRRDTLGEHPLYRDILARPLHDAPRLALANAIEHTAPLRARHIRMQIELAKEECYAIVAGVGVDLQHEASAATAADIARAHHREWRTDGAGMTAGSHRGFGEYVELRFPTELAQVDELFASFPILHAYVEASPEGKVPRHVGDRIDGLASVWIEGADDDTMLQLIRDDRLRTLRRLKVQGHVTMSVRSVELLCDAPLPALEELEIWGGTITNPCDLAAADDWADRSPRAYAIMSRAGAELEKRHGYRKFLHAASRFSVYPCSPAALDILPPLPPERFVRPRQWGDR